MSIIVTVSNKLSRSAVANGGFGDPDLTPKPLRISKREHPPSSSTASTLNPSLSRHKSQTQGNLQALAPGKKPSTRVNSTQLDLSLRDLTAPTSQWARRNTFLHVHKQRQSEPTNTSTAALVATSKEPVQPIGPPADSPARSRDSWPRMSQLGSISDAVRDIPAARPASVRAFTAGTFSRHNPLSPVHELSSSSSPSPALTTRRRRAVTNAETSYKDWDNFISSPHRKVQSQGSTKNSLMSRVMSGFTNRSHVSHTVWRGAYSAAQTPPGLPPRSRARGDGQPFGQRRPSTETDTCGGRKVYDVRATYPTPPTSGATSSTAVDSLDSHRSTLPERLRELCKPADAALMGAELTLTPEYDELSSEKERSMWVSLDIKGTTNLTSSVQDVWSQHTGLDIVVIIDNSLHTSPAALMASCETARFLASILNKVTDRLAILCTSAILTGSTDSKVVRRLSEVPVGDMKSDLDAITRSKEMLKAKGWMNAIDSAKEILLKSTVPDPGEELVQDTFGHIFLLTPDADGLSSQSLAHDALTFHIICPASVPWNKQATIRCNGWEMRSLSGNETQVVSRRKDLDPMSITNRLRVLIAQARSGKVLGNLTEPVLEVSAGPDCIVEGVIGTVNFKKLHPGEVFTVLFRVTVRDAKVQERSFSSTATQSSESLLDTGDVLGELDKIFGTIKTKVLTARLTYKHSLLPQGTTCTITTDCHVNRVPPDPDQEPTPSRSGFFPARECTILVDKRRAYYLATGASPRNALENLQSEFCDDFQLSACRDYIHLLANELKYQARITERLELAASPRKRPPIPTPKASSENCSPIPSDAAEKSKAPHRATSDIPTEELFNTAPALAVLSPQASRETTLRTDEARRIWGDLRRLKRPSPNRGGTGKEVRSMTSSQVEEKRRLDIRELALKNKRSLGADTLRSIFSVGENAGKGLGSPWL